MHEPKDYYAILGVPIDADQRAIKQAFRRLARQSHPDVKPGDQHAEERFKQINEAYQILSDTEQRLAYDRRRRGTPLRGRDIQLVVDLTLEEVYAGAVRLIQLGDRQIEARIPRGVQARARVRLRGQGGQGSAGGACGDLYLFIRVTPHARFQRNGDNLALSVPIDLLTAANGGAVLVETLDGAVMLTIPPRTRSGTQFRLAGKGLPHARRPHQFGDMYVQVTIRVPETIGEREIAAFKTLGQARTATKT